MATIVTLSRYTDIFARFAEAVARHEPSRVPIVVADGPEAYAGAEAVGGCTVIDGIEPFRFARNANLGMEVAAGDVLLVNDDVILEAPVVAALGSIARSGERIGIVSPRIRGVARALQRADMPWVGGEFVETRILSFACVYIRRACWEAVGPFDERFVCGWEDDDYCDRALAAGWRIGVARDVFVTHAGSASVERRFGSYAEVRRRYGHEWGAR